MTPSASSRIHIPGINPAVLKWAREWRGKTTEEAATKLRKRAADIVAWEQGQGGPTVKQARALAGFYERPFLEFFLAAPPELDLPELVPDYRMHAGESPSQDTRGLRAIQQWAEAKRVDALDLFNELDLEIPQIPSSLFAVVRDDPEVMAARSRDAIAFSIHEQMELTKHDAEALPTILRDRKECLGVLTFRRPDLKRFRARGMCIALFPLPVIIVQNAAPGPNRLRSCMSSATFSFAKGQCPAIVIARSQRARSRIGAIASPRRFLCRRTKSRP